MGVLNKWMFYQYNHIHSFKNIFYAILIFILLRCYQSFLCSLCLHYFPDSESFDQQQKKAGCRLTNVHEQLNLLKGLRRAFQQ